MEIHFSEHPVNMDRAKDCKSNFIQPDFTILIQFWLSVNNFKVLPIKNNLTRYCYMTIESRLSWNNGLKLADDCQIKGELLFWLNRVQAINIRELASYSRSSVQTLQF
jgi:hypothetical protein